jgi:hypothetical protein
MGPARPAPLPALLGITFLGSVSGGAFWAGTFFVTAQHYAFSATRNLVLAGAMGGAYALAARGTGTLLRRLERWGGPRITPRAVLAATLIVWGIAAMGPLAFRAEAALWGAALVGSAASAVTWPIVESYLGAGRHGARMRSAIGWFNVTWTPAVAVPLLLLPLFAKANVLWTIGVCGITNAGALLLVLPLPARPGAHAPEAAHAAVGPEYPWLSRSASWLLPLSYVMSSTLAPVLPHRLAAVGVGVLPESVVADTWLVARFLTLAVMWRVGFWHGRWGTLALAGLALVGGLALTLLAPTFGGVVLGLLLFGAGMGLTYYAALYYALAVGHAAVDAGGTFEALIGLGYCVGPALGLVGHTLGGGPHGGTVALTSAAALLASAAALRPYLEARRRR